MDALASLTRFEKLDELKRQINQKRIAHAKEELLNSNRDLGKTSHLFEEEKDKEKKKTLECKIREIKDKINTHELDKRMTEKYFKKYINISDFKNLYRSRKREIEVIKNFLPVCEAEIDGTKREVRMMKAKESLNVHQEDNIRRMENWVKRGEEAHSKLLEYIEEKRKRNFMV